MKKYIIFTCFAVSMVTAISIEERVKKDPAQAACLIKHYQELGTQAQELLMKLVTCTADDYTQCLSMTDLMQVMSRLKAACEDEKRFLGEGADCSACKAYQGLQQGIQEYLSDRLKQAEDPADGFLQ